MSWLLDTNVISEWVKPRPDPRVARWIAEADEDRVFLSVVTFAEIRRGIEEMNHGARRTALQSWLERELPERFQGRILGVNLEVADAWGVLMARSRKAGIILGVMDTFLAATAQLYGLALVTRNTKHFENLEIALVNPWTAS